MNLFDIIGPIMIGPSSSHTSGVVRIGNVVNKILGQTPSKAIIKFHGSFAKTYLGHGSHKAIIAGLMGYASDDARIKKSIDIAKEIGMEFEIQKIELEDAHPNTVIIEAETNQNKKVLIKAESIGGGNILIKKIDNFDVRLNCQRDVLLINIKDALGMISEITEIIKESALNISNINVYRSQKGGHGIILIETDEKFDMSVVDMIAVLDNVEDVKVIPSLN